MCKTKYSAQRKMEFPLGEYSTMIQSTVLYSILNYPSLALLPNDDLCWVNKTPKMAGRDVNNSRNSMESRLSIYFGLINLISILRSRTVRILFSALVERLSS